MLRYRKIFMVFWLEAWVVMDASTSISQFSLTGYVNMKVMINMSLCLRGMNQNDPNYWTIIRTCCWERLLHVMVDFIQWLHDQIFLKVWRCNRLCVRGSQVKRVMSKFKVYLCWQKIYLMIEMSTQLYVKPNFVALSAAFPLQSGGAAGISLCPRAEPPAGR